jgi:peptidoglycan/LPS O-acetylase OafA/YrhL
MVQSENTGSSRRIFELDALRALAAINLMLFHFTHVYSVKYGYSSPLGFEFPWGKYGVQLFFMLSGLVNALTILRKCDSGKFLTSRALRIMPCYYIVLGLNLVLFQLMPLAANDPWTWPQLLANLTIMPNLLGYECFEPVMWTLQVEVLFYGILLFLFTQGRLDRPIPTVCVGLAICVIGCWGIDAVTARVASDSFAFAYWNMIRQLFLLDYFPLFAVGILLHDLWLRMQPKSGALSGSDSDLAKTETGRSKFNLRTLPMAHLFSIAGCLVAFHLIDHHGHNPVVSIGLTVLLGMSLFRMLPPLRHPALVFISGISYMLYLIHDNLGTVFIYWLNNELHLQPLLCFLLVLPFTLVVSIAATFGLERPLTRYLRGRLVTAGAGQVSPQSLSSGVNS